MLLPHPFFLLPSFLLSFFPSYSSRLILVFLCTCCFLPSSHNNLSPFLFLSFFSSLFTPFLSQHPPFPSSPSLSFFCFPSFPYHLYKFTPFFFFLFFPHSFLSFPTLYSLPCPFLTVLPFIHSLSSFLIVFLQHPSFLPSLLSFLSLTPPYPALRCLPSSPCLPPTL